MGVFSIRKTGELPAKASGCLTVAARYKPSSSQFPLPRGSEPQKMRACPFEGMTVWSRHDDEGNVIDPCAGWVPKDTLRSADGEDLRWLLGVSRHRASFLSRGALDLNRKKRRGPQPCRNCLARFALGISRHRASFLSRGALNRTNKFKASRAEAPQGRRSR